MLKHRNCLSLGQVKRVFRTYLTKLFKRFMEYVILLKSWKWEIKSRNWRIEKNFKKLFK